MDQNIVFILVILLILLILLIVGVILYLKHIKSNQNKVRVEENFNAPTVFNANLLYTDQNGNLGSTSDIGINYLTVSNGTKLSGGVTIDTLNVTSSITSPTITNLQNQINTINSTLTSLQNKINTINSTLTSLQNQITTNTNTLKGVTNDGNGNITIDKNLITKQNIRSLGNIILNDSGKIWADGNAFQFQQSNKDGTGCGGCRRVYWWNGSVDNCYGCA